MHTPSCWNQECQPNTTGRCRNRMRSLEGGETRCSLVIIWWKLFSTKQSIDTLISFNDFDWIKSHIQIIHPHAESGQKKAIARLFVLNNHFEELLSKHCVREMLLLKRVPTNVTELKNQEGKWLDF